MFFSYASTCIYIFWTKIIVNGSWCSPDERYVYYLIHNCLYQETTRQISFFFDNCKTIGPKNIVASYKGKQAAMMNIYLNVKVKYDSCAMYIFQMNSGQQKCGLAELLALSHSEFDTQIKEMSLKVCEI